jgi:cell division protein FtsB
VIWRIVIGFLVVLDLVLVYRIVHPETGVPAYRQLRERTQELRGKIQRIDAENKELSAEIRLLRKDEQYVRRLVRRELLYAEENEIMYIFK